MTRPRSDKLNTITSRDVARAANVSQALVSRAFSGNGRIAADTRERIFKAAAEIGWQPNALAASMVTGDAPLVAVITTRLSFDWRAQVLSHLLKAFEERHLQPLLFHAERDEEVDRLLAETISWRTRGVVVTAGVVQKARAEAILSRGQFLAALNRPANHERAFAIATDNRLGGRHAATVLADEGRQRLLVLAGPADSWASRSRTEGFVAAARDRGIEPEIWCNDAMSTDAGGACARRLLELSAAGRPDAVFATNDALGLGFIDGLRSSALGIPSDLSLVGFDNLPASAWAPYRLTTFEQPLDTMVAAVVGHIENHRQSELHMASPVPTPSADGVIYCPPQLIVRNTTRGQK
ncbi:DNA-binding LacI/PurR family transcriptional regulator [Aminobacter niigataensis]|uniref:DNA-binding LacI/PurR family transcriptional regulator n=1 Tax=Aminobacter niigataensis TaxID=83265 RepID=A0ABR6L5W1_9HYPH|nr:LacI family DNA-binding transcriptional regulator [Aminobacter niigataensis]MBB4652187.1 DNA-binding LacI/PurR family transcriptional regulator [Aminobacter niigataensis]